jgi:hypothetical protein
MFITKKYLDEVSYGGSGDPWRRSSYWMSIKAFLNTILVQNLANYGRIIYKIIII